MASALGVVHDERPVRIDVDRDAAHAVHDDRPAERVAQLPPPRPDGREAPVLEALPDGLIVPVLRSIDQMGLKEIRVRSADLVERARSQRLKRPLQIRYSMSLR